MRNIFKAIFTFSAIAIMPCMASAQVVVYEDTFDDADGIEINQGIGGGMTSGTNIAAAVPFDDASGDLFAETDFGNQIAVVFTNNQFDLSGGFTLDLTYFAPAAGFPSYTATFGIIDEVTAGPFDTDGTGPFGNLTSFLSVNDGDANIIGFAIETNVDETGNTGNFPGAGLNSDFGTLESVSLAQNANIILGAVQDFTLTVNADGSYSFAIDDNTPSVGPAGTLSAFFDNSADGMYSFAAYSQGNPDAAGGDIGLTFQNIRITVPGSDVLLGDVNQDGVVDLVDVAPFVDLLLNGGFLPEADLNGDGLVDLVDVAPFVALLLG